MLWKVVARFSHYSVPKQFAAGSKLKACSAFRKLFYRGNDRGDLHDNDHDDLHDDDLHDDDRSDNFYDNFYDGHRCVPREQSSESKC